MSKISLVLSDVDGTLVTSDKRLTEASRRAVRRLAEHGIAFPVTSSRPPIGLRMLVAPLVAETEYHVAVRSHDGSSADSGTLSFTTPTAAAATELTECTTIDSPGSYRLAQDVSGDCTCFDIQAADVELDLDWHTVTYAAGETAAQCHGIAANGRASGQRHTSAARDANAWRCGSDGAATG